jgi:Phosphodiester glycosidase
MVKSMNFRGQQSKQAATVQVNQKTLLLLILPILSTTLLSYATNIIRVNAQDLPRTIPPTSAPTVLPRPIPTPIKGTPRVSPSSPSPVAGAVAWGNEISLNGRILPGVWMQQRTGKNSLTTHLSDGALRQLFGADLLDTNNPARQPIQWFSSANQPQILSSRLAAGYRYLDITNLAKTTGWQTQNQGNTLVITTTIAKITNLRQDKQIFGDRVFIDLNHPAPWQVRQELPVKRVVDPDAINPQPTAPPNRDWTITIDGIADPILVQRYTPLTPTPTPIPAPIPRQIPLPNQLKQFRQLPPVIVPGGPVPNPIPEPIPEPLIKQVEVINNQTVVKISVPFGFAPRISTAGNPNTLIIEVRPDALVERTINWAPGLRWQQRFVNLGTDRFPVVSLEINPRTAGLKLRPISTETNSMMGTAPLLQMAQQYLAYSAINAGFFNRNNRLPLGAIRRDGQWFSGPILNRGAIAWNDSGQFYFGRLSLQENLVTTNNQRLPILFLNTALAQSGIARYTPTWGQTYTPLTDNEIVLIVQRNQIINQIAGLKANQTPVPIPQDGYLLTLRGTAINNATALPIGTNIRIESASLPGEFNRFPQVIGAGPLLVQNQQVVLDARAEGFSNAFIAERAVRSAVCNTATGNLMIVAVHNRAAGAGPTLAEHAVLMQQIGCVNALNLDGGSSTSLYLGGQLIDRSASTAARVHNGIGVFLRP